VLKPTGSLYLHCDPTASHYLKVILDTVFDPSNFRNEIIWHRYSRPKGSQHKARRFGWSTDTILFYSRSDRYYFDEDKVREPISEAAMEKRNTHSDAIGPYYSGPLLRSASMGHRPNLVYEYKGFTPGPEGWRMTKDKLEALDARGDLMWTSSGKPRRKVRPQANPGNQIDNLWADIGAIASQGDERLGYPTQKPIALLERIIQASSKAGDVVLDPFCGCGTAIAAAQKHGRRWIGIDITHLSIALQKYRLAAMFPGVTYRVVGEPEDVESARQLAQDPDGRYKFQWWALSLIKARPLGGQEGSKAGRKGSDSGIDGVITFMDDNSGKPKRVLVQAKSGGVKSGDIRDLVGTLDREKAAMGVFITLEEPSRPMLTEASAAGVYQPQVGQRTYPRVQILTVAELLDGAEVKMPPTATTFKQAQRADDGGGVQAKLAL